MNARKVIPPPKGAERAADAAAAANAADTEAQRIEKLSNRYGEEQQQQATLSWGTPAAAAGAPAAAPAKKAAPRRREPEGMTRETYYVSKEAVDALAAAVETIQKATKGQVKKHEALAALFLSAAGQADALAATLRADLLRDLSGE